MGLSTSLLLLAASVFLVAAAPEAEAKRPACRHLPGDRDWPSARDWNKLNTTVGGRLIQGVPVAQVCYGVQANQAACAQLRTEWSLVDPLYVAHPPLLIRPSAHPGERERESSMY